MCGVCVEFGMCGVRVCVVCEGVVVYVCVWMTVCVCFVCQCVGVVYKWGVWVLCISGVCVYVMSV